MSPTPPKEGSGSNLESVSVSDVAFLIYKSLILPLERVNRETAKYQEIQHISDVYRRNTLKFLEYWATLHLKSIKECIVRFRPYRG